MNDLGSLAELELGEKILEVIWAWLLIAFQTEQLGNTFFGIHKRRLVFHKLLQVILQLSVCIKEA